MYYLFFVEDVVKNVHLSIIILGHSIAQLTYPISWEFLLFFQKTVLSSILSILVEPLGSTGWWGFLETS